MRIRNNFAVGEVEKRLLKYVKSQIGKKVTEVPTDRDILKISLCQ